MKYENESDPSVNWGHLTDVDFTADTDHVSAEAAERYAYDQAELWADVDESDNAAVVSALRGQRAERKRMQQGGIPALPPPMSLQDTIGEIAHMMMHLDEALMSLFCAAEMDLKSDDHWLHNYFGPAAVCVSGIFELLGVERLIPQCMHCGDETSAHLTGDEVTP